MLPLHLNSIRQIQLEVRKYLLATGELRDWLEFYAANTRAGVMEMAAHNEIMNELCSFHAMMNMSPRERAIAEARERYLFEKGSMYSAGIEHGENRHARQVATKLLARNAAMSDIVDLSGLPEEEILKIAANMAV